MWTVRPEKLDRARDHAILDDRGHEWIPATIAAGLLPSVRPGRKVHISSIKRYVAEGRLEGMVRRTACYRHLFVRLDQVLGLLNMERVGPAQPRQEPEQEIPVGPRLPSRPPSLRGR